MRLSRLSGEPLDRGPKMRSAPTIVLLLGLLACDEVSRTGEAPDHSHHEVTVAPPTATETESSKQVFKVGPDVVAPVVLHRIEPDFELCIKKGLTEAGIPHVEAVVDADGTIKSARIPREIPSCLDQALLAAVRQWHFRPGTYKGKAVPVEFHVTTNIHWR